MDAAASMKHFVRTDHSKNLQRMFADHFDSELFCDVTISCRGRIFKAHKLVLSISSAYFETIFQHDSAIHPIVYIPDVSPEIFELVLDYCYKGKLLLPKYKLVKFLKACKILQIKSLCSEAAAESMDSVVSDTDKESTNATNLLEKSAVGKAEASIDLNDSSITFVENLDEQKTADIMHSPPASHIMVDDMSLNLNETTQDIGTVQSPPSSIGRKNAKKSLEPSQNPNNSPPSSPESFVFDWQTNLPKNTSTQNQSVILLTQPANEVIELSSEEFADQIEEIQPGPSKINRDNSSSSEDVAQIGECAVHTINSDSDSENVTSKRKHLQAVISDDSDDSEIVMLNKRRRKIIKTPAKRLKVVVSRMKLIESNKDSSDSEEERDFLDFNYTTGVMGIKDVPKDKVQFYCNMCRRCVKPFLMARHRTKHTLY